MSFFRRDSQGLVLTVRAAPKASRDAIVGVMPKNNGLALKIAVSAPPDKGKANAALLAVVVAAFGVAKRDVRLISGDGDRRKVVQVAGDPAALAATAQQWMPK